MQIVDEFPTIWRTIFLLSKVWHTNSDVALKMCMTIFQTVTMRSWQLHFCQTTLEESPKYHVSIPTQLWKCVWLFFKQLFWVAGSFIFCQTRRSLQSIMDQFLRNFKNVYDYFSNSNFEYLAASFLPYKLGGVSKV